MVRRALRSRSFRKISKKIPGSKVKKIYVRRKPKKAKCAKCGAVLSGVPRERPYKMKSMAASKKKPSRPYAANLCSKCTRLKIKAKARSS